MCKAFYTCYVLTVVYCNRYDCACSTGSVLCDTDVPVKVSTRLQAQIIIFDIEIPITVGFSVSLFLHALIVRQHGHAVKCFVGCVSPPVCE